MDVVEQIRTRLDEIAGNLGFELVELSGIKLGGHTVIRAFIYKPDGITVRDCAIVSRAFSDYLDLEDPIHGQYRLEVSSLGLDRPLVKPSDFRRRIGESIKLELEPHEDSPGSVKGKLVSCDDKGIVLDIDNRQEQFAYDRIIRGKIIF